MKTEEIKPGDILYDEERKMLVKVARVDEDGVVKYSAITDMKRIFQTPPPPYRRGTRTADAYVPATDEQRKYMERELAVCEYVNLPKDNRIETLAYIIAELKAENMELEQRVQQIAAEYSNAVCQSGAQEKRKDKDQLKQTIFEMREQYDKLEREYKELRFLAKGIHSFVKEKKLYIKKDYECPYCRRGITACSTYCKACGSFLGDIYGFGVICEKRLQEVNVSLPTH